MFTLDGRPSSGCPGKLCLLSTDTRTAKPRPCGSEVDEAGGGRQRAKAESVALDALWLDPSLASDAAQKRN
eukprot:15432045-Alexandrium_andersonii.AAC.1